MTQRVAIAPERAETEREGERHATWVELFFDLIFVVAIAQLAVVLAGDVSPEGVGRFVLLFVPVWWAWANFSVYADRFESDDSVFRISMLAAMGTMAAVAVNIPDAFGGASTAFAASYIAVRIVLIGLWERVRRRLPEVRALATTSLAAFVVGTSLWALSLLLPDPARFGFWIAALAVEVLTPWLARRAFAGTPMHASHLAERFGLFVIIVLGESVVALVLGLGGADWSFRSAAVAALGFVAVAALWWVYFGFSEEAAVGRSLLARNVFIYGHLPLALGLTATGVGIKKAVLASEEPLAAGVGVLLCGGVALFLVSLAALHAAAAGRTRERLVATRSAAAAVAALLAVAAPALPPLAVSGVLVALLLAVIALEAAEKARESGYATAEAR